jgi:hypothetical protein
MSGFHRYRYIHIFEEHLRSRSLDFSQKVLPRKMKWQTKPDSSHEEDPDCCLLSASGYPNLTR